MITKYDVQLHMEVNTSCAMQPYGRKRIHKKFCRTKVKNLKLPHRKWHKCKRVKTINKNIAGDELKFEDFKKKFFHRLWARHEINRIQGNDHIERTYRIS